MLNFDKKIRLFSEKQERCDKINDCELQSSITLSSTPPNGTILSLNLLKSCIYAPQLPITRILKNQKRWPIAIMFRLNYLIVKYLLFNTPR